MTKIQFLNSLSIALEKIKNGKNDLSSEDFNNIKFFIINNPNDPDVLNFKKIMIDFLQKPFLEEELINALRMPDDLKYLKKQRICQHFPLKWVSDFDYRLYFYNLFYINSNDSFWMDCINFFKSLDKCIIPEDIIEKLNEFIINNDEIIRHFKDDYKTLDEEIKLYKEFISGKNTSDYGNYMKYNYYLINEQCISDYNKEKMYANKKIGNIGELYIFEQLKNYYNTIFAARDIGNGFGFDFYSQSYQEGRIIENLIEVKSTTNLDGNDFIKLSSNELKVMKNALSEPNVNYYICRVFIDFEKDSFEYYYLKLEGNTLKDINNNIEYKMDENNECLFHRKQKIK